MMDFHKGRWRLALGRLVNLRYINRWIIFSADLFVSLSVSLLGVLGMFSILHIRIGEPDVLKVGLSSFVASIVSFLLFKAWGYSPFHAAWLVADRWCCDRQVALDVPAALAVESPFQPFYLLVGWNHGQYVDDRDVGHVACLRDQCL